MSLAALSSKCHNGNKPTNVCHFGAYYGTRPTGYYYTLTSKLPQFGRENQQFQKLKMDFKRFCLGKLKDCVLTTQRNKDI